MDFTLSSGDHPSVERYKSATVHKPRSGVFWREVGKLTTSNGQLQFPLLVKLIIGLSAIPVSIANSERGFSVLRKIHADQHPTFEAIRHYFADDNKMQQ